MVTNLEDGDTQVVCGDDLIMFALTLAATMAPGMTAEQAVAFGGQLDAIAAADTRPPKPPARRPRAKAGAAEPPTAGSEPPVADSGQLVALPKPCEVCGSETGAAVEDKLVCANCHEVLSTVAEATEG